MWGRSQWWQRGAFWGEGGDGLAWLWRGDVPGRAGAGERRTEHGPGVVGMNTGIYMGKGATKAWHGGAGRAPCTCPARGGWRGLQQLVAPLNGLGEVPFLGHLLPPLRAWRQPRHTLHTLAEFIVSRGPGRRGCGTAGRGLTAT
ncbi:hypothetical protein E2C01_053546 [Portunus trituberculatus]|uniref:Uncharacterized protein n=1 Tax=Portunus trituberculatus TaxID=210409 RepID=A0A5B7GPM8_PORTR|nr:hypothetical protein [Portunus trituberculatus]